MKVNKKTLKEIIKEELEAVLDESQLLDRYSKDKEEEFRQYLQDMGKDPDEIINALGPEQSDVMRQSLIDDYPTPMKVPGSKPVRGGEQILKLLKIMGEREKPTGPHATPTGKVEKRDHGAFGVGYDVAFEFSDGKRTDTSIVQMGDKITFAGKRGKYTVEQAIDLLDSQKAITYDDQDYY